ncbi:MAG: lytic transglycosylase domain-containing protein [Paracoccus sp. (in: a-proteobacteria)]|uniref:lytic transglycosylase domain-containing protein n=1 Tax=Paracoccus sp. TaxID=267 RepID=UPI0026DED27D|nr:lytic transglycosylase domain-containing protein [Paracoccus sp. (in: a-proteobacteria)]MDO5613143.1 lytic transglycosylase domain-containing protein [Paracoccus sp. (in: a-proteobacteria)]
MKQPFQNLSRAALLAFGMIAPAQAENAGAMALALSAAEARDWTTARDAAAASGPLAETIVGWQALRSGHGEFADYLAFVRRHPDWPGLDLLRQRGDAKLRPGLPAADVIAWLDGRPPQTLAAEQVLLAALPPDQAAAERARFWAQAALSVADAAAFLAAYPDLAPLTGARIAYLLDQQEWAAAEASLPLLPEADRALPAARIALQAGRQGVDDLILALPDDQRADPGLTLDRFLWRVRNRNADGARALMLDASTSAEALRRPELWGSRRADYARAAMRAGDWPLAERFAANHFLPQGDRNYADLEWLAGYAALRQGAADRALDHFLHLETQVGAAISTSRALYWQARALDDLGRSRDAQATFARAAQFPGTYYGQLAVERSGAAMPAGFAVTGPAIDTLPDWRGSDLRRVEPFRAALWLIATGRRDEAQRFLIHLAATASPDDIARMSRLMYEAGAPWFGLRLSKQAASKGVIFPAAHFPLTDLADKDLGVPTELALSIARQESEFNHRVASHAGAQGLMQVMPDTARDMARRIGEPYDLSRLTSDPAYNARLGGAYLRGLRDRFGASVALVASGYNAGPGRPARWLGDFGDLRQGADPVDWVELIPFDETRNYVMRVAEAQPIYRARLSGKPAPIVPTFDLTGGGIMPPPPLRLTLAMSRPPVAKPFIGPQLPPDWRPPVTPQDVIWPETAAGLVPPGTGSASLSFGGAAGSATR